MDAFTTNNLTSCFFTVPADNIDVTPRVGVIQMAGVDERPVGKRNAEASSRKWCTTTPGYSTSSIAWLRAVGYDSALALDYAVTLVPTPKSGAKLTSGSGFCGAESFGSQPAQSIILRSSLRPLLGGSFYASPLYRYLRWVASGPQACAVGMISMRFTLTCAGCSSAHKVARAMSSAESAFRPW